MGQMHNFITQHKNIKHQLLTHCLDMLQILQYKTQIMSHVHTYTRTQPFHGSLDFVRDNPGEPVTEETFTHSHSSWSLIVPYLLHPSNTIYGILPIQFMCGAWQSFSTISLQVFFGLPLGLAPSTSYSIHFFTQSLSSFSNTCPYHRNLFCNLICPNRHNFFIVEMNKKVHKQIHSKRTTKNC